MVGFDKLKLCHQNSPPFRNIGRLRNRNTAIRERCVAIAYMAQYAYISQKSSIAPSTDIFINMFLGICLSAYVTARKTAFLYAGKKDVLDCSVTQKEKKALLYCGTQFWDRVKYVISIECFIS